MKLHLLLTVVAFAGGMAFQQQTGTKEKPVDWGENPMENPEFLKAMEAAAALRPEHAEIAKTAGTWDVENKMTMQPGAEPVSFSGTSTNRMVLGGRYLVEEYKSELMGMPFEGILILGYDNLADEYVSIWFDNMSTWPSIARGKKQTDGKVVQTGEMKDVLTPGGRPYRHVSWEEGDELRGTMYDTLPDGTEFVMMEMTYRRKK
ncbi:MAG: DUF1579 domain-containing protein [Planctomycetota bacterium]